MTVQEFCDKWGVKRSELSILIDVSQGTMSHWFSEKEIHRTTPPNVQRSLMYLDYLFTQWLQSETLFPEVRAIFETLCDRGTGTAFQNREH